MCRAALPIANNRNTPPLCQPAALHPSRCIIFCTSLYDVFLLAKSLSVYQYHHSKHIPLRKTSPSVKPLHMTDMKSGQKERGLVGWTDGRYLPLCLRPLLLTTGPTRSVVRGLPCGPAPLGRARRRYRSYTNSGRGATRKHTGGRGVSPAVSSVGAAVLKTIAAAGGTRGRAMMPTIPPCKGPAQRLAVSLAFPTCNLAIRR